MTTSKWGQELILALTILDSTQCPLVCSLSSCVSSFTMSFHFSWVNTPLMWFLASMLHFIVQTCFMCLEAKLRRLQTSFWSPTEPIQCLSHFLCHEQIMDILFGNLFNKIFIFWYYKGTWQEVKTILFCLVQVWVPL